MAGACARRQALRRPISRLASSRPEIIGLTLLARCFSQLLTCRRDRCLRLIDLHPSEDFRAGVSAVIRRLGAVDVAMEHFGSRDERPLHECQRVINEECDIFVGECICSTK